MEQENLSPRTLHVWISSIGNYMIDIIDVLA